MYAIEYKARNGKWAWLMESKNMPRLFWCMTAAKAYMKTFYLGKYPEARPVKVKIVKE